ncbi:MAG: acetate--CoA ligase family protein [Burkholderiales bacterium]|nr:acetate--CoA ligase family protein [Burkholderiales bacterium]
MPSLTKLLSPRSIAVVGASERPDAIGTRVLANLKRIGFPGPVYPVNPRYERLGELDCYPSLSALPEAVDAAFIAVPAAAGPDLVDEAGRAGIGAAVVNANGYADGGDAGIALQRRLEAEAAHHKIALCGPNNIGFVNVHDRVALWSPRDMRALEPGSIAVISQSGSIALILGEDERDLGLAYMITAGNEANTTVADYLEHVIADDRVDIVLIFLETIRDPQRFALAADEAVQRGKRIVVLKLGASAQGRQLVQAHTGSLAGEDRLYDAWFRTHGVIRVRDLDEMLETATLLRSYPTPRPAGTTALVTLSGGEAALIADLSSELGLALPPIAPATLAAMRPAFPDHSSIANPVDAWGLGFNGDRFRIILDALLADSAIDVVGFSLDAPGRGGADVGYGRVMAEACVAARRAGADKRMLFLNNTSGSGVNPDIRAILERAGIPYLSGMRPALAAVRHLLAPTQEPVLPPAVSADIAWIAAGSEPERFAELRSAGLPMTEAAVAADADEAVAIAARLGGAVVLKGIAQHLPHKSDLGLVALDLVDADAIRMAWTRLRRVLDAHSAPAADNGSSAAGSDAGEIVVQPMAPDGVELILGIRNEPGFGSFIVVGPGGVLVEIGNQASIRLGPVGRDTARAMLAETAAARLLGGVRGRGPWDLEAAIDAIVAFSALGHALRNTVAAMEINPLIVGRRGAVGVDILVEPH